MTTSNVRRLNTDIKHYRSEQSAEKKAVATQKKDATAEKSQLAALDQQKQQILDSFSSALTSGQPFDPASFMQDLTKMAQLGEKRQQTQDKFDTRLSGDEKSIKRDQGLVKKDHQKALKDLKPAEYDMNLKQTNNARKELGLKKVNQVIRPPHPTVGGQVGKWISQAQEILAQHGVPYSKMNAKDLNIIIQHESSGNPNAENLWDSNAAAGHPSIGLMQTIGPTFDAYKLPGHGNIRNPIDNIIAGVRYAISRYGSISNVPGVVDVHAGGAYVGY
jgi:hypothetical protein